MKLKKLLCLALAVCLVLLSACTVKKDDGITGDVKDKNDASLVDTKDDDTPDEKTTDDVDDKSETSEDDKKDEAISIEQLVAELGCVMSDGGEYKEQAVMLCQAVVDKDAGAFAEFTMGKREYYDFLNKAEISSYTLYPFEYTDEKLSEMNENHLYPVAYDNYLVEFDVGESECEEFKVGKNLYYFGLELNPISGNLISAFVPYDKAEESMTETYDTDFAAYFIDEFSAFYLKKLYDGRNYPDSFDFSESSHLITHLMARSGVYGEPPYTFNEVNEFITETFDGNEGLSLSEISANSWTSAGIVYPSDDPERIYGCSWGHGGTSAEHEVTGIEEDGNRSIYTVQFYADYSKLAKALCVDFYFDKLENGLVKLTMVQIYENTGREIALISI